MYNFIKNFPTVFWNCYFILQLCQESMIVLNSLYYGQYLILSIFLILVILVGVECYLWYLIVALKFISPNTNNVEHLFFCILVICISYFVKYISLSFIHFSWVVWLFLLICKSSLYLNILEYAFHKCVFRICGLPFHFLNGVFDVQKFSILIFKCSFFFIICAFSVLRNLYLPQFCEDILMFLETFLKFNFLLKSMILSNWFLIILWSGVNRVFP